MKGFYLLMAAIISAMITTAVYFQFFRFLHWYQVGAAFLVIFLVAYLFVRQSEKDENFKK